MRLLAVMVLLAGCGEGMPTTCRQILVTPTAGCFWISSPNGDLYVKMPVPDGGAPHGHFDPCTEALSCADDRGAGQ